MKFFKHIILSVFVLGAFAVPANAQTDVKALTGALAETIREYANYADTLAYRIAFANRKNPTVLLGIAEAYNMNQDFDKTKKYAMQALEVQPDFAPSYVLLGRHCQYKFEHYGDSAYRDTAIIYYKKAMEVNPLYPDSYDYYAIMKGTEDPEGVLRQFLQLRDQRPDLNIGGTIAALQVNVARKAPDDTLGIKMGLLKRGITTYEEQGNENLTLDELNQYCSALDLAVDWSKEADVKNFYREKIVNVASFAHEKEVTDPRFLSVLLAANYGLERYQDAIKNANELFQSADTAKLHYRYMPYDYRYKALSMFSLESIDSLSTGNVGLDAAVDEIEKGTETGLALSEDMSITMQQRELAVAQYNAMSGDVTKIVNALIAKGKYDQALHIREYQKSKKSEPTFNDWLYLINVLQAKYENAADATEKSLAQRELIDMYTKVEQEFSTDPQVCRIYYNHAATVVGESHPKDGIGLALYTKLFNLEASNQSRDSYDDQFLAIAAQYLSMHAFYNNDYETAMKYALVLMDYDMTYSVGDQIFNACSKAKPKTAARMRAEHRPV
ncbi:MAG: hypothetical protein J5735_06510 [Prevotella sp.]|nr:hypothetical protein [Prevotella sp.]